MDLRTLSAPSLAALAFLLLAAPAAAVQSTVDLLLDLDDDPTTGCTVTTPDGPFDGVEQILSTTIDTTGAAAADVTAVDRMECVDPGTDTFGPSIQVDMGDWPVGVGLGVDGFHVVETYFPLTATPLDPRVVRIGVVHTRDAEVDALLVAVPGTETPILLDLRSVLEIPTLGEWGLILLILLLAASSLLLLGRRGTAALVVVLLLSVAGVAWAQCVLDGMPDEWSPADLLGADPAAADDGISIRAVFGKGEAGLLCLRTDVSLTFDEPPTITDIADQTIPEDGSTGPLAFTVDDAEDPATALTVTAISSNQILVPDGNLTLGGSGANRTITVTPEPNQNGMTLVTVTVEDTAGGSASTTFQVTVTSDNDPPTITAIADQTILEDSTTGPLAFTVDDVETPAGSLTVTASSNDQTIIPDGNLVLGGSGANRTITVTPAADQNGGPVTVTVLVQDGDGGSVPEQFGVTVTPVNDAPSFALAGDVSSDEDAPPQTVNDQATAISPGPANEAGQTVTFQVTNDNNALFSSQPAIDAAGILTYTSAPNANGSATVTVTAMDDGGTPNGGSDTSAAQMFTITVNPVNDPPMVTTSTISYAAVGNTLLRAPGNDPDHDGGVPGRIASTSDASDAFVKAGPSDPDSASVGFQAGTFATNQGGSLTIDDDGDFHYTPPTGVTGVTDDVMVQVEDTEGLTTPVTIEITLSEMVWYVEDTTDATKNPAGGPGTSRDAFETLAAAEAASGPDHYILVFETDAPLDEGITLQTGQKLYGQRVEEEGTPLLPGGLLLEEIDDTNALPEIDHTSGDAVTVAATGASLADVEIRHLDLTGSDNAIDVTADAGFDAGVLIRDNELAAGGGPTITASTTATAGTMTLQILENLGIAATGVGTPGISVDGSAGGTLLVTAFADNEVDGATTGHGFFFDTVTFDGDDGAANLQTVDGNATSAGTGGNPVGGSGMVLDTVTGDLAFDDLDLAAGLSGLVATGTGEFTGAAGFRITTGSGSTIVANGGPAVDVDPATVALTLDSITSASSPTTGISLVDVTGSATIGGGSITGSAGNAVHLTSTLANPLDVTYSGTVTNASGRLLNVDGLPTDSDLLFDGTSLSDTGGTGIAVNDFDGMMTVTATTTTIANGTSTGFAATGDTDGTVNLDDVTITNPAGTAVHVVDGADQIGGSFDFDNMDVSQASNARLLDVQGLNGGSVSFDSDSALSATAGTGINVSSNAGTSPIVLGGPVDLGTSGNRISAGTAFSMGGNSAGTSVTAPDVDVFTSGQTAVAASGSGVLDLDALSIDTASDGRALDLTSIQSLVDVDSVTCSHNSNCVDLTSLAMSSTTTFAGAALTCTGGTCFNASSARTVEVTGGGNTISATNAVGIDLDTTTIGANHVTFESISASGAANGIVLNNTGTTGDFTVTGTGTTDASGGHITGTTGHGVLLTDAQDVTLRNVDIGDQAAAAGQPPDATSFIGLDGINATDVTNLVLTNLMIGRPENQGIDGTRVTGFTLSDCEILNAGDDQEENALDFGEEAGGVSGLFGTASITNCVIDGFNESGLEVRNFSGNLSLTVTDTVFANNQGSVNNAGEEAILLSPQTTATMTVAIQGTLTAGTSTCRFQTIDTQGVDATPSNSANLNLTVSGCEFDEVDAGDGAIKVNPDGAASTNFSIVDNHFDGSSSTLGDVIFLKNDTTGTLQGTVQGNTITTAAGQGIELVHDDQTGAGSPANGTTILKIGGTGVGEPNNISGTTFDGILINARETPATGGSPDVSVIIQNNVVGAPSGGFGDGFGSNGILVRSRDDTRLCAHITGNDATGGPFGAAGIRVQQEDASTFQIQGLTGGAAAYVQAQNPLSSPAATDNGGTFSAGTCPTPAVTPTP